MHEAIVKEVLNVVVTMSTMIGVVLLEATVLVGIVSVHLVGDLLWMTTTIVNMEDGHRREITLHLLLGDTIQIHTMPEALLHQREDTIPMPDTRTLMPDRGLRPEVPTEAAMVATMIVDTEDGKADFDGTPWMSGLVRCFPNSCLAG